MSMTSVDVIVFGLVDSGQEGNGEADRVQPADGDRRDPAGRGHLRHRQQLGQLQSYRQHATVKDKSSFFRLAQNITFITVFLPH